MRELLEIVGKVDKRVVVYPLLKIIGLEGSTGVVTDDRALLRVSNDIDGRNYVGNCELKYVADMTQENMRSAVDSMLEEVKNVVYVSDCKLYTGADKKIEVLAGGEYDVEDYTDEEDTEGYDVINIEVDRKKVNKQSILVTEAMLMAITNMEINKELCMLKDKRLEEVILNIGEKISINNKDMRKLMTREDIVKGFTK